MSATLAEGAVFAGRYRVVRSIAAGGMGAVYEVVHLETERRRALKVMHPHLFQSEEMRQRFKREARIAAHIESEHIVDVADAGVDQATGTPYLVMELLRGEELGERLRRLGRFTPGDVVTYLQQVAWALDRTHAASIVHRDLKPENLFLTFREDGSPRIKILDFGVAKLVAEGATGAGATRNLGTPLYMSPEQFRTNAKLTGAVDIYALGMMGYTLLVGEPYWNHEANGAGNVIAFAMAVIRGPQESAVRRALVRGVTLPPAFDAWFGKVAAENAADRYPTATAAVQALREALDIDAGKGPRGLVADANTGMAATLRAPGAASPAWMSGMSTPTTVLPLGQGLPSSPSLSLPNATSPNSVVTHVPVERKRAPRLVLLAALALVPLGVGAWVLVGALGSSTPAAPAPAAVVENPAAPVATVEAPVASVPEVVASVAPPPTATRGLPAPDAGVGVRPSPTASVRAVPSAPVPSAAPHVAPSASAAKPATPPVSVAVAAPNGCKSHLDCKAGQVCPAGRCVAPSCVSDTDCGTERWCSLEGVCMKAKR